MKSRLAQRKERAQQARRMHTSLTEMTSDSLAAEDRFVGGAVDFLFLAPLVTAGAAAAYLWWRGEDMTLGHLLAIGAAVAILGYRLWRGRKRRAAR